jgi:hypothetical protein
VLLLLEDVLLHQHIHYSPPSHHQDWIEYLSVNQLPDDCDVIKHNGILLLLSHEPHHYPLLHHSDADWIKQVYTAKMDVLTPDNPTLDTYLSCCTLGQQ